MKRTFSYIVGLLLIAAAFVMSVIIVYSKHQQRLLNSEIYRIRVDNEELLSVQSQLLLESSTLSSYNRIQNEFSERKSLRPPEPWEILWLRQE